MIKNQKDFAAGLFYIAIGLFGATTLGENEIGSLSRMGPGYFPLIISTGIILTGLAIAVKSLLLTPALPSEGRIELGRPFSGLLILGSVALYAATLLTLGFVLSISLMVIAASCAHPLFRLRDAVISAVILTTLSALLFVGGLGLIVRHLDEPALLLRRRDFGYACRSTGRHGPRGHCGDAPSHHVCA